MGTLINIFVRSQDPNQHDIHNILTTHIIKNILQECVGPIWGCQGVVLQVLSVQKLEYNIKDNKLFTKLWMHEGDILSAY